MKNKVTEANVSMVISKTFSGLNMNALKYLLPLWMTPLSGVTLRCTFAAVAFWIIGMFTKPETSTRKEKISLFLLGALGIYSFMFFYLIGLSKTTPVSSSIFTSLEPIWVFILAVIFFKEKITKRKRDKQTGARSQPSARLSGIITQGIRGGHLQPRQNRSHRQRSGPWRA